jgi:F-type H+-transporting ATPase subunit delta
MSQEAVAARYAEALFEAAREQSRIEELRKQLDDLVQLAQAAPDLRSLLARPDVDAERKLQVLQRVLGRELAPVLMGLVEALLRHNRGDHLGAVKREFARLADAAAGVVRGEVRTVVPLTDEQRRRLTAALERVTGARVLLSQRLDPTVVAGAVVQLGDRLVDGSAAGRLARMRGELMRVEGRNR